MGHGKTFATQILKPKCRIGVPSYQDEGIPRHDLAEGEALMLVDGRVDLVRFERAPRRDVIAVAERMTWRAGASSVS